MSLLIGLGYIVGGWVGWRLMDRWLENRRRAREARMRNVTPQV